MACSAPRARTVSSFAAEPAVAMTRAPCSRASWIAAWPTPLVPAITSTVSPVRTRARVTSMCQAVRKVSGNAAASRKPTWSGIGTTLAAGTTTSSA